MIPPIDRPSLSPGASLPFNAELHALWEVSADSRYGVTKADAPPYHVAIQTNAGEGELLLERRRPILLEPDSLIIVEAQHIRRYRCSGPSWQFWWFQFTPASPLPYAMATLYPAVRQCEDDHDFRQVFTKLQHPAYPVRCVASSTFCTMLHRWLADAKQRREKTPHRQIVETIIARIHDNVADDWSGPRLARESGLCESTFRRSFRLATGQSPAQFIRVARLHAAYQMCQERRYTLASIADQLNFSSPFHLSAAFKQQFGISPSAV